MSDLFEPADLSDIDAPTSDALIERPLIADHEGEYLISLIWPEGLSGDIMHPDFTEYLKTTPAAKAFWTFICQTEAGEDADVYAEEFLPNSLRYGARTFASGILHCGWYRSHDTCVYLLITEPDGSARYCLVNSDAKKVDWMFLEIDEQAALKGRG